MEYSKSELGLESLLRAVPAIVTGKNPTAHPKGSWHNWLYEVFVFINKLF